MSKNTDGIVSKVIEKAIAGDDKLKQVYVKDGILYCEKEDQDGNLKEIELAEKQENIYAILSKVRYELNFFNHLNDDNIMI